MAKTYDSNTTTGTAGDSRADSTMQDSGRKGGAAPATLQSDASSVRSFDATAQTSEKTSIGRWLPLIVAFLVIGLALALGSRFLRPQEQNRTGSSQVNSANQENPGVSGQTNTVGGSGNGQGGSVNGIGTGR